MSDAEFLESLRKQYDIVLSKTDMARLVAQGAALGYGDEIEALVRSMSPTVTYAEAVDEIRKSYEFYLTVGSRKDYAINYRGKEENFAWVMKMANVDEMALLSREEILEIFEDYERYENMIKTSEPFEMAKVWLSRDTNKLLIAREWLSKIDPTLFFIDVEEDVED